MEVFWQLRITHSGTTSKRKLEPVAGRHPASGIRHSAFGNQRDPGKRQTYPFLPSPMDITGVHIFLKCNKT